MMVSDKRCYFCHNTQNLHIHHIFSGTANRKKSDLKKEAQKYFEANIGTREKFMQEFGRNYL